jgi:hypothetical protein
MASNPHARIHETSEHTPDLPATEAVLPLRCRPRYQWQRPKRGQLPTQAMAALCVLVREIIGRGGSHSTTGALSSTSADHGPDFLTVVATDRPQEGEEDSDKRGPHVGDGNGARAHRRLSARAQVSAPQTIVGLARGKESQVGCSSYVLSQTECTPLLIFFILFPFSGFVFFLFLNL